MWKISYLAKIIMPVFGVLVSVAIIRFIVVDLFQFRLLFQLIVLGLVVSAGRIFKS